MTTAFVRLLEGHIQDCRVCPKLAAFNDSLGGKGVGGGFAPAKYFVVGQNISSKRSEAGVAPFDSSKSEEMRALYASGERYGHTILPTMLYEVGWPVDQTYFSNVIKCSTPDNREPTGVELNTCATTWLRYELTRCKPEVVIALGTVPFEYMCERVDVPVRRVLHHSYICFRRPDRYDEWAEQWKAILEEFRS